MKTKLPVYIRIAEAVEMLEDPIVGQCCMSTEGMKDASERMDILREPLTDAETDSATELVRGSKFVEVPGDYNPEKPYPIPEPITLFEPRTLSDYITAPCKHECNIFKQIRHAKQAHRVLSTLNPIKQTLLRATAGQCGLDSAHCHSVTVKDVDKPDRTGGGGSSRRFARCSPLLRGYSSSLYPTCGLR